MHADEALGPGLRVLQRGWLSLGCAPLNRRRERFEAQGTVLPDQQAIWRGPGCPEQHLSAWCEKLVGELVTSGVLALRDGQVHDRHRARPPRQSITSQAPRQKPVSCRRHPQER